jgi:hypothetical protein
MNNSNHLASLKMPWSRSRVLSCSPLTAGIRGHSVMSPLSFPKEGEGPGVRMPTARSSAGRADARLVLIPAGERQLMMPSPYCQGFRAYPADAPFPDRHSTFWLRHCSSLATATLHSSRFMPLRVGIYPMLARAIPYQFKRLKSLPHFFFSTLENLHLSIALIAPSKSSSYLLDQTKSPMQIAKCGQRGLRARCMFASMVSSLWSFPVTHCAPTRDQHL